MPGRGIVDIPLLDYTNCWLTMRTRASAGIMWGMGLWQATGCAGLQHPAVHMRYGAETELIRQFASISMCVGWCKWRTEPDFAVASTLKSEISPGEVFWGIPQLNHWTDSSHPQNTTGYVVRLGAYVLGLGLLSYCLCSIVNSMLKHTRDITASSSGPVEGINSLISGWNKLHNSG